MARFSTVTTRTLTRTKVVTSGGIGPTSASRPTSPRLACVPTADPLLARCRHDDITYESIARAFGLELRLNDEAFERMRRLAKSHPSQPNFSYDTPSPALEAKLRMLRLPVDAARPAAEQVLFVKDDLWVPVAVVNGNVHVLPGVPRLFEQLLDGLKPGLVPRLVDPEGKGIYRMLFSTPLAESEVATYLKDLAARVGDRGIKVGSYPRWGKGRNTVTLVGRDTALMDSLVAEVEANVQGPRVSKEDELDEGDVEADEG